MWAYALVPCGFAAVPFAKFQYQFTFSLNKCPLSERNCCDFFKSEVQGLKVIILILI